jgi:hypoxanthine phosphoribosyltransferase
MSELRVLISREQISKRVAEMGAEITRDFRGEPIIFVGVLKGAAIFLSDLARQVALDASFDFIGVSSYGNRPSPAEELRSGWDSTGEVRLTKDVDQSMSGKNVILVEDILDTGLTLTYLRKLLLAHQPKSLRIAALLDKPSRRKQPIQAESPTSLWWVTDWTMPSGIAACRIFAWCRGKGRGWGQPVLAGLAVACLFGQAPGKGWKLREKYQGASAAPRGFQRLFRRQSLGPGQRCAR